MRTFWGCRLDEACHRCRELQAGASQCHGHLPASSGLMVVGFDKGMDGKKQFSQNCFTPLQPLNATRQRNQQLWMCWSGALIDRLPDDKPQSLHGGSKINGRSEPFFVTPIFLEKYMMSQTIHFRPPLLFWNSNLFWDLHSMEDLS